MDQYVFALIFFSLSCVAVNDDICHEERRKSDGVKEYHFDDNMESKNATEGDEERREAEEKRGKSEEVTEGLGTKEVCDALRICFNSCCIFWQSFYFI